MVKRFLSLEVPVTESRDSGPVGHLGSDMRGHAVLIPNMLFHNKSLEIRMKLNKIAVIFHPSAGSAWVARFFVASLCLLESFPVRAQTLDPYYAGTYNVRGLGLVPGLPGHSGGLAFKWSRFQRLTVGTNDSRHGSGRNRRGNGQDEDC